jgi:CyaY protein
MSAPADHPPLPSGSDANRMADADYLARAHALLQHVESTVDGWLDTDLIDIDTHRTGGLLELHFPNGSKIIINTQPPLHEVWLAAKGGGFHYRWNQGRWEDTRNGSEFLAVLSHHASLQGAQALTF